VITEGRSYGIASPALARGLLRLPIFILCRVHRGLSPGGGGGSAVSKVTRSAKKLYVSSETALTIPTWGEVELTVSRGPGNRSTRGGGCVGSHGNLHEKEQCSTEGPRTLSCCKHWSTREGMLVVIALSCISAVKDRLLVAHSQVPGSIPGATKFSE
jgi:hypothetical protein